LEAVRVWAEGKSFYEFWDLSLTEALHKMKFGRHLLRTQLPEWSAAYINYKGLKKLIKAAVLTVKTGKDPDLAGT